MSLYVYTVSVISLYLYVYIYMLVNVFVCIEGLTMATRPCLSSAATT